MDESNFLYAEGGFRRDSKVESNKLTCSYRSGSGKQRTNG
jgi:hypothetical protein